MHEVDNQHLRNIEFLSKLLEEGILLNIWLETIDHLEERKLTMVGTEDVSFSTPSTPEPATDCPNL